MRQIDTYTLMCSDKRIQAALKWEPRVEDRVMDIDTLEVGYVIGTDGRKSKNEIWLPNCEDLVERLKDQGVFQLEIVWDKHEFSVVLNNAEPEDYIWGDTIIEFLLQAFAWTIGLKWENGKWEKK